LDLFVTTQIAYFAIGVKRRPAGGAAVQGGHARNRRSRRDWTHVVDADLGSTLGDLELHLCGLSFTYFCASNDTSGYDAVAPLIEIVGIADAPRAPQPRAR